jgi:hypothetical protein
MQRATGINLSADPKNRRLYLTRPAFPFECGKSATAAGRKFGPRLRFGPGPGTKGEEAHISPRGPCVRDPPRLETNIIRVVPGKKLAGGLGRRLISPRELTVLAEHSALRATSYSMQPVPPATDHGRRGACPAVPRTGEGLPLSPKCRDPSAPVT